MQLEHNVHESSDLLNTDSLDDRADESPERAILPHARHQSPAIGHSVTGLTGNTGTGQPGAPVTPVNTGQIVSIQSTEHIRLGLMLLITGQLY